jgi:hypothetical protein
LSESIIEATFFYQEGKGFKHGNFNWASQSALLATLPLLIYLFKNIKANALKLMASFVLAWQFLVGIAKFVRSADGIL